MVVVLIFCVINVIFFFSGVLLASAAMLFFSFSIIRFFLFCSSLSLVSSSIKNHATRIFFFFSISYIVTIQTRRELRASLESELASFDTAVRDNGRGNIAWNHQQFEVLRV